jgi:class 3 adenylate cyclase
MSPCVARYTPPASPDGRHPCALVLGAGTGDELRCPFIDHVEIGRDDGRPESPGVILVRDPAVSRRHCGVSRRADGRCFIRDLSLNGTRLDGRRLVPNVEVEVLPGQRIAIADGCEFLFEGAAPARPAVPDVDVAAAGTLPSSALVVATILVGDIRDFTVLVRTVPPDVLQPSVNRVFARLTDAVGRLGGTVKEFQGDAIVAFWEGTAHGPRVAEVACRAALELDGLARALAVDPSAWQVAGHELHMDWAMATGPVMINAFGGDQPAGLSMIGEPIVLAFRLEKFASAETGRILACPVTRRMANRLFEFRDLGTKQAKGFDKADHVFALEREHPDARTAAEAGAS